VLVMCYYSVSAEKRCAVLKIEVCLCDDVSLEEISLKHDLQCVYLIDSIVSQ